MAAIVAQTRMAGIVIGVFGAKALIDNPRVALKKPQRLQRRVQRFSGRSIRTRLAWALSCHSGWLLRHQTTAGCAGCIAQELPDRLHTGEVANFGRHGHPEGAVKMRVLWQHTLQRGVLVANKSRQDGQACAMPNSFVLRGDAGAAQAKMVGLKKGL